MKPGFVAVVRPGPSVYIYILYIHMLEKGDMHGDTW